MKTFSRPLIALAIILFFTSAYAEKIYHWRDANGQVHYSSTPPLTPLNHGDVDAIELKSPIKKHAELDLATKKVALGQTLWAMNCATCHHIGSGWQGKFRGLPPSILDKSASFDSTLQTLRNAADGNLADMDKVDLSLDEVTAIAKHIMAQVSKSSPSP